ncbi:MAG: hypothetical protein WCG48_03890 [Candidatus Berkelbacteria bacterium]
MVKVLYKIFLAVIIALFVGFGINVFYEEPKVPDFSDTPFQVQKDSCLTAAEIQAQTETNKTETQRQNDYQKQSNTHSRNVSIIAIIISILLLIVSLTLVVRVDIWSDGTLFGGLLTLVYGIIRGMASLDSKFQFIAVSVGLLVVLAIGYIKFIKNENIKS